MKCGGSDGTRTRDLLRDRQARPAFGLDEFPYKFGWLQDTGNSFTGKSN